MSSRWQSGTPAAIFANLTPGLAHELLALNDVCRTEAVDRQLVSLYAQEMAAGRWWFTGDTIKVNVLGGLVDGQHRLLAAVEAQWSGPVLIVVGIPIESAWAMDPPGKALPVF